MTSNQGHCACAKDEALPWTHRTGGLGTLPLTCLVVSRDVVLMAAGLWIRYQSLPKPVKNPKKQTLQLNRRESTQLARWKSVYLRPLVYKEGAKGFPMCTRCKTEEATSQHILNCIGKDKRSLYREPRRVLKLLYEHDLQDLV
ncbi:CRLS1 [Cordylochernes scorpioides]|uniref:CRLS1 n=1 Tax=Cordylochernes scorpioides TaxID=51811 RepID=A0ABY6KZ60_9ARAC|nr:CRLS1 [Cordylochernes scorpioides]